MDPGLTRVPRADDWFVGAEIATIQSLPKTERRQVYEELGLYVDQHTTREHLIVGKESDSRKVNENCTTGEGYITKALKVKQDEIRDSRFQQEQEINRDRSQEVIAYTASLLPDGLRLDEHNTIQLDNLVTAFDAM
jgi:isopentenyldiphosphate isomerase